MKSLQKLLVPRTYFSHSLSLASYNELLLFSDASEKAVASVAYMVSHGPDASSQIGFVMGKTKVAPSRGHTIPRLELCGAVLSVETADFILEQIDTEIHKVRYFTDSKVVLGYICNRTRRFHTYVSHRVERILNSSQPAQWCYVDTSRNPADTGTRGIAANDMADSMWLLGPPKCVYSMHQQDSCYPLLSPEDDKEVRQEVISKITKSSEGNGPSMSSRFQKCSSFARLARAVSRLQHIGQSFSGTSPCVGWHLCPEASTTENLSKAQNFIVKVYQQDFYPNEVRCLNQENPVPSHSIILPLNPFLDENGLLRVGGRLKHSRLSVSETLAFLLLPTFPVNHMVACVLLEEFLLMSRSMTIALNTWDPVSMLPLPRECQPYHIGVWVPFH